MAAMTRLDITDERPHIGVQLVAALVAEQFPRWAELPVRPVAQSGWDNRTFHLGDQLLVRLPSNATYVGAVAKEQRWLPLLAPQLPLPIPAPVALGRPGQGYPWPWSVYRWIEGETSVAAPIASTVGYARDLAAFLTALQAIDAEGGPPPGQHNWWRGGSPGYYDEQTRQGIGSLDDEGEARAAHAIWEAALAGELAGPVWFHGDIAPGNLLVRDGRLSAVIDFGTCGIGDPACDLAIAWTVFDGEAREAFRDAIVGDAGLWARARGWAMWKALLVWALGGKGNAPEAQLSRRTFERVLEDHRRSG
jgi:aminoglycoside phosphotransferase (APT) family kinase protein